MKKKQGGCGQMGIALSMLACCLMAFPAWGAPAAPDDGKRDSVPGPRAPLADLDGDGISDGLAEKLDRLRPDEVVKVIVTFNGPGNSETVQRAVGPFQVHRKFDIIPGFAGSMRAVQARALAGIPGVFRVEEDFPVHMVMDAAGLDFGIEAARDDSGLSGAGAGICIVDTGIDPGHEQLDAAGKIVAFRDFVNGRTEAYDDQGHGTHVAAIAAGDGEGGANASQFMGVAPGASLFGAKVLDSQGSGNATAIIDGIEWCASRADVDIISMSLGTSSGSDGRDSLSLASDAAADAGKIVVVAAGNSGDGESTVGSPGAAEKAITVGAVAEWSAPFSAANHSDGIFLAWFSSRGPIVVDSQTQEERIKPDIVAPGVTITSAKANSVNGYATFSGTSMATPFISGTIALALENGLLPGDVKMELMNTAQDRGDIGIDNEWGAGLVDGYDFITSSSSTGRVVSPVYEGVAGIVGYNETWRHFMDVENTDAPIGITITIKGDSECLLWLMPGVCWIMGGPPDLDARLIDPGGNTIDESTCPGDLDFSGECGSVGRQETIHWMPTKTGRYILEVYPYEGALEVGEEAEFLADISFNIAAGSEDPPADTSPPAVTFIDPKDGAVVSGNVPIRIESSDNVTSSEDLTVEVSIDGGSWGSTAYNSTTGHFETTWESTSVTDGSYSLTARSTDGAANFEEATITVTVNNGTSTVEPSVHVAAMEGSSTSAKNQWFATVRVTIHDQDGNAQPDAIVTGSWNTGASDECVSTDENGTCTFTSEPIAKKEKSMTFKVDAVISEGKNYEPADNESSEITVYKP